MKTKDNIFIIIGAQRSGTTYLYTILDEHPEICMSKPVKPEPKFFLNNEYNNGIDYYIDKYYKHLNIRHKILGEKSTSYFESEEVAYRISKTFPHAKILFLIRNPVQRAISNYFFSKNNNLETRSLEEVFIKKNPHPTFPKELSTNPFDYLERGKYLKFIKFYLKYFPSENFKIIVFEKMINNLDGIQEIYRFLDVDCTFKPNSVYEKINTNNTKKQVSKKIVSILNNYFKLYNKELWDFLKLEKNW